jgi:hypothetical protein
MNQNQSHMFKNACSLSKFHVLQNRNFNEQRETKQNKNLSNNQKKQNRMQNTKPYSPALLMSKGNTALMALLPLWPTASNTNCRTAFLFHVIKANCLAAPWPSCPLPQFSIGSLPHCLNASLPQYHNDPLPDC